MCKWKLQMLFFHNSGDLILGMEIMICMLHVFKHTLKSLKEKK